MCPEDILSIERPPACLVPQVVIARENARQIRQARLATSWVVMVTP